MIRFGSVFLLLLAGSALWGVTQARARHELRGDAGPAQNERLTALDGLLLFILLAAIAVTILDVRRWLGAHYLVGFVLIPPLTLKLGSTGYRLFRYYSGSRPYRLAGAPPLLLRFVVAPVLVVSTAIVFGSGLELWLFGLRFGSEWILAHTLSAVVMMFAVTAHSVAHLGRSFDIARDEVGAGRRADFSRQSLVIASLAAGAVLAIASLTYASPFSASVGG